MLGIYARLAAVAVLVIALAALGWKIRHDGVVAGRVEIQAQWDSERAEMQKQAAAALAKSVQVTSDLQAKSDALRRAKNAQIDSIGLELAESLKRLRSRAERPNGDSLSPVAGAGASGCTPSQLYRSDASLALQIAADADRLRIGLQACQAAYESAREALK